MVIIITIRANHGAFHTENYPSLTCPSPETAPKCPDYPHQGHTMCCENVCVCACVTNPLTLNRTRLRAPQRSVESVGVRGDNRGRISPLQGAAAARLSVQPEDVVCQRGAQLAYLLRPAHNELAANGLESLAAECGTAGAGVCVSTESVRVWEVNGPISRGHSSIQEMRWKSYSSRRQFPALMFQI